DDLLLATLNPDFRLLVLAQHALVEEADRLVGKAGRKRANFQALPTLRPGARDHCLVRADDLIEIIEDRRALDQCFAIVQNQRRHPAQRIEGRDLITLAEGRPRTMLEAEAIEPHRDCDTAD